MLKLPVPEFRSGNGCRHSVVPEIAVVGANLLPRANRAAALLQRWLLGTHQGAVAAAHLDYYFVPIQPAHLWLAAACCFNDWSNRRWP